MDLEQELNNLQHGYGFFTRLTKTIPKIGTFGIKKLHGHYQVYFEVPFTKKQVVLYNIIYKDDILYVDGLPFADEDDFIDQITPYDLKDQGLV